MGHTKWSEVKRVKVPPEERIAFAMESGTRSRLTGELHLPLERADELLDAWALVAAERGLDRHDGAYWDDAWPWLAEHARR
jgi:hypothetical protein